VRARCSSSTGIRANSTAIARLDRDGPGGDHIGSRIVRSRVVPVCGRTARRVEVEIADFTAFPSSLVDGVVVHGSPTRRPARIEIRIELELDGLEVRVVWDVERRRRARFRALERAFLASVTCSGTL
jgi:hypothetical protein